MEIIWRAMIKDIINTLQKEWDRPKRANHLGELTEVKLCCEFSNKGIKTEKEIILEIPESLKEFWSYSENATLFKDSEFGQWGLEIFSPKNAIAYTKEEKENRPKDFISGDLIIGRFLGDSDLLVISCDRSKNFGEIIIALPIDPRSEWPRIASDFGEFLERYSKEEGAKYWEE